MERAFRAIGPDSSGFDAAWERFVLPHREAGLGHLSANFQLADIAGVRNRSILVVDGKDEPVSALPLFELTDRQLRLFRTRVLSSSLEFPAHPLLASHLTPRIQREVMETLIRAMEMQASLSNADSLQVLYPVITDELPTSSRYPYCPLRHFGFLEENTVTLVLDLELGIDELSQGLEKSCRNIIRRAEREGCQVRPIRNCDEWMNCFALARETLGPLAPTERAHQAVWDLFVTPGYAIANAVLAPGRDLPSNVVVGVGWRRNWYYWKSYSTRTHAVPGMNNLALWQTILSIKQGGARFFEVGGIEFVNAKQIAISDFKRSFGGTAYRMLRGILHRRRLRGAALNLLSTAYQVARTRRQVNS